MNFLRKTKEVTLSSLPLFVIIGVICFFVFPMNTEEILKMILAFFLVIFGQVIFLVGLDNSILPMGKIVGGSINKLKKVTFIVLFGFVFGVLVTIAEPSVTVLASQVFTINPLINFTFFVWLLGFGVGVFVAFALYRIIKNISLKWTFFITYILLFIMLFFVPNQFILIAFDAGGATTGSVSVPFILALGVGVSTTLGKNKTNDESFGIIGLASIGPIFAVFLMGLFMGNNNNLHQYNPGANVTFIEAMVNNLGNVLMAVLPIVIIFIIFQLLFVKLPKKQIRVMMLSSIVVTIGLLLFLVGVNFGLEAAGKHIGEAFLDVSNPNYFKWILLPVAFLIGFTIVYTEPGVVVLGEQVEEITSGLINKKILKRTLGIAIAFATLLGCLKIILDISILYFFIPIYVAALILMFFSPNIFTALAFDSGGVVSGAITAAFLTPLTIGASQALGQDPLLGGFGIAGFISGIPLIALQVLGVIYNVKIKQYKKLEKRHIIYSVKSLVRKTNKQDKKYVRYNNKKTQTKNSSLNNSAALLIKNNNKGKNENYQSNIKNKLQNKNGSVKNKRNKINNSKKNNYQTFIKLAKAQHLGISLNINQSYRLKGNVFTLRKLQKHELIKKRKIYNAYKKQRRAR